MCGWCCSTTAACRSPWPAHLRPGRGGARVDIGLVPVANCEAGRRRAPSAHWPAAWLSGLGTPWNTLQLGGVLRVSSDTLAVEWVGGRACQWTGRCLAGQCVVPPDHLDRLGPTTWARARMSKALSRCRCAPSTARAAAVGRGHELCHGHPFPWRSAGQRGRARALDNLLNIIGRRSGDRSVISSDKA